MKRRQFIAAAAAASVASLSVDASDKDSISVNASETLAIVAPIVREALPAFTVHYATITDGNGVRVAAASLEKSEVERFVSTFNRINANGDGCAELHSETIGGALLMLYFAVIEKQGEKEICIVDMKQQRCEGFEFTYNHMAHGDERLGKASVVERQVRIAV